MVLDNLTDLCLIYDFGKPSKSLVPDETDGWHKYMHRVKGIDFLMDMLSPARLLTPRGSKNFCPENFKFARFWEGIHYTC